MPDEPAKDVMAAVRETADVDAIEEVLAAARAEEQGESPEAEGDAESTPPAAPEGEGSTEVEPEAGEEANAEAPEGTAEEPPTTYFGVDLSDLDAESRTEVIGRLKEQDTLINQLMQANAELAKGTGEQPPAMSQTAEADDEPEQPMSDEDVMRAFGVDPEDPMYEVKAEVLLPVARRQAALEARVEQFLGDAEAEQVLDQWNSTFDALEAKAGVSLEDMGVSRLDAMQYGLDHNILDPTAVFTVITADSRAAVQDAAAQARKDALAALKREQAGGARPKSRRSSARPKLEATNVRDGVSEALEETAREMGVDIAKLVEDVYGT